MKKAWIPALYFLYIFSLIFAQSTTGDCSYDNGGCDFRVTCETLNSSDVLCGSCPIGTVQVNSSCLTLCGNTICEAAELEDCITCPQDCGYEPCGVCGDLACDAGETCSSCFSDCGPCDKKKCEDDCNDHGDCVSGFCECNPPWNGPSCDKEKNQPIITGANASIPFLQILHDSDEKEGFYISLLAIRELDQAKNIFRHYYVPSLNFTLRGQVDDRNYMHNYSITLDIGATVTVIIRVFREATEFTFGDSTSTFGINSIELYITITDWPFYSTSNYLAVVMQADAIVIGDVNYGSCLTSGVDESGSLRWLKVILDDDISLYAQFVDRAILDGRIMPISYSLEGTVVTAIIPHFWNYVDIDPNYALLKKDPVVGSCKHDSSEDEVDHGYNIAVIVVICIFIVVVLGLVIVGVRLVPRWKLWCKNKQVEKYDARKHVQLA